MTERTLTVEREETMNVCDVCGREPNAYDARVCLDLADALDRERRAADEAAAVTDGGER